MTAPDTRAAAWLARASATVADTRFAPRMDRFGRVASVADGIAMLEGLADARLDELLTFSGGQAGFVHSLTPDRVVAVLLDDAVPVAAGDTATGTGDVVRVPVGRGLLGRVVDPLGRPLDGKGGIACDRRDPIERPAPGIVDRAAVSTPLHTGVVMLDAMFPIGRGQRELILGDRGTGKTTLALDAMLNQAAGDVVGLYVAIGQKSTTVERTVAALEEAGALSRSIVVAAGASAPAGMQWIAPFAAMTMAESIRDTGGHALIVLDDLVTHAACHREIALLTGQPPGREAYPGDVFYLHARLLERAAKLSPELGGGSLTALPIVETEAGNLSAYVPTNLISITDGQIVLDARLFDEGQRPAVDAGLSVSRVGGKAQVPALREAAQTLRLDYAQFLELEVFTRFGGIPDARVRARLDRGRRIRALLTQDRQAPLRIADQIALILAVQEGLFDAVPEARIAEVRAALAAEEAESLPDDATLTPDLRQGALDRVARLLEAGA